MNLPTHQLTMTVLMTPDMANFAGNVHGGTIWKFLDQVAYPGASRYAARYGVTLSVDQGMFRQPIRQPICRQPRQEYAMRYEALRSAPH